MGTIQADKVNFKLIKSISSW